MCCIEVQALDIHAYVRPSATQLNDVRSRNEKGGSYPPGRRDMTFPQGLE
jgi:hypothetical protein